MKPFTGLARQVWIASAGIQSRSVSLTAANIPMARYGGRKVTNKSIYYYDKSMLSKILFQSRDNNI